MSNWISIEDKLPEEYTAVQVFYQADLNGEPVTFISFATYKKGEWYLIDDFFGGYVLDVFYGTYEATDVIDGFEVTHWTPLPEPPKGVDNE